MSTDNQSAQSARDRAIAEFDRRYPTTFPTARRDIARAVFIEGWTAALAQAPAPSDVYPCVKLTVSEDGSVAASLYAPGLPAGVFNVYPLGIEDVSTGAPAPSGETSEALRLLQELWDHVDRQQNHPGPRMMRKYSEALSAVERALATPPTPEQAGPSLGISADELFGMVLEAGPSGEAQVPDGVWEALQRMIEDGLLRGAASKDDALTVARYRDRVRFLASPGAMEGAQAAQPEIDLEAIGWAYRKLSNFGVLDNTMENALMADRLKLMMEGGYAAHPPTGEPT